MVKITRPLRAAVMLLCGAFYHISPTRSPRLFQTQRRWQSSDSTHSDGRPAQPRWVSSAWTRADSGEIDLYEILMLQGLLLTTF